MSIPATREEIVETLQEAGGWQALAALVESWLAEARGQAKPVADSAAPKAAQIVATEGELYALGSDGRVYSRVWESDEWALMPPLPAPEPAP
jgi:hypothetical protein